MDETTIIILIVGMFFCLALIGGGYYYTTTLQEGDEAVMSGEKCSGMDANAIYEYDENGQCSLKECKEGFFLQNGHCIRQVDTTVASQESGEMVAVDCEIKGYTKGACLGDDGMTLLGTVGSCGKGTRQLFPADILPAINGGKCNMEPKTEECEVACPDICVATDDNYTSDGACISQGKELGDVYCGSGMQNKKLDPTTVTGFESNELRDAWIDVNWKGCAKVKSLPCEVECVQGKVRTDCPALDSSVQKSYVVDSFNKPICFKSDYAQSVLESGGLLDKSPENILPSVTADEMWDSEKGEYNPIPTGKQIAYRSGGGMSFNDMVKSGCINYELEECQAPQVPAPCKVSYNTVIENCTPVKCGGPLVSKVQNTVVRPAFGGGACSFDDSLREEVCANQFDKACCDPNNDGHWLDDPYDETPDMFGYTRQKHNPATCSMLGVKNRRAKKTGEETLDKNVSFCSIYPGVEIKDQKIIYNPEKCGTPQIYVLEATDSYGYSKVMTSLNNNETHKGNDMTRFPPLAMVKVPIDDDRFYLMVLPSKNNDLRFITIRNKFLQGKLELRQSDHDSLAYQWNPYKYTEFIQDGDFIKVNDWDEPSFTTHFKKLKLIKLEDYNNADKVVIDSGKQAPLSGGCKLKHPEVLGSRLIKDFIGDPPIARDERYIEFVTQNPCENYYNADKKKEYEDLIASIKST